MLAQSKANSFHGFGSVLLFLLQLRLLVVLPSFCRALHDDSEDQVEHAQGNGDQNAEQDDRGPRLILHEWDRDSAPSISSHDLLEARYRGREDVGETLGPTFALVKLKS
eukprot:Skav230994  [mRNA]  locus=scaffold1822:124983:126311:+ [translate_table: standard]